jgi:VanZ family protein
LLAVAYLVFVIYGSLVPLDYRALPLEEALARFREIPYLTLGIGSRADWVANILLFVPLAFLWLGAVWHRWNVTWRVMASLGVWLAAVVLSLGIEFSQLFFPQRTVSQNDILAETIGAALGIAAWWALGPRLLRWSQGFRRKAEPWDFTRRILYVYLAGLAVYNVLPLDLTLSPVELWHKLREGRLIWIPFAGLPPDPAQALYDLATDALIWVPVGFLWCRGALWRAVRRVLLAALLLEFLQLWVYSRVSDVTDILTAALGGCMGAWLAANFRFPRGAPATGTEPPRSVARAASWTGVAAGWIAILGAVFWYPYDFQFEHAFLAERVAGLARAPFTAYYYGTEYRAATEVLHKLLFFLPLGVVLQLVLGAFRRRLPPRGRVLLALLAVGLVAAGVEGVQLALPGKNADLTDWGIEFIGGLVGALIAARWSRSSRETPLSAFHAALALNAAPANATPPAVPAAPPPPTAVWIQMLLLLTALAGGLWFASRLAFVPYNVQELIGGEHALLSAMLLAAALVWVFGFPAFAVARCARRSYGLGCLVGAFVLHGAVAWLALRAAVPLESVHDIVGSPVLDWPWEWELMGRFLGLFLLWSVAAFGAVMLVLRPTVPAIRAPLVVWGAALPILIGISYYVVVAQAATDNLTELLAQRASLGAFLWLWSAFLVAAVASAVLGVALGTRFRRGAKWGLALAALSPVLVYAALSFALESHIVKYDRVFSAFQFLLSSDREHYAGARELVLRYVAAYVVLVAVAAASAALFLGGAISAHTRAADQPVRRKEQCGEVGPER